MSNFEVRSKQDIWIKISDFKHRHPRTRRGAWLNRMSRSNLNGGADCCKSDLVIQYIVISRGLVRVFGRF